MKNIFLKPLIVFATSTVTCMLIFYTIESVKQIYILPEVLFGIFLTIGYGLFTGLLSLIAVKFTGIEGTKGYIVSGILGIFSFIVWVILLTIGSGFILFSYFIVLKLSILIAWAIGGLVGFVFNYHLQRRSRVAFLKNSKGYVDGVKKAIEGVKEVID